MMIRFTRGSTHPASVMRTQVFLTAKCHVLCGEAVRFVYRWRDLPRDTLWVYRNRRTDVSKDS